MAFEQKDGSGALFKNDRKEKETHPDYRGDCKIDGVDYWISAWVKEGKRGKFFSLSIQPKEQRAPTGAPEKPTAQNWGRGAPSELDDEIPF